MKGSECNNQLILREEMATSLSQLKLYPAPLVGEETKLVEYTKVPLSRVTALGTSFEPIVSAVQNVMGDGTTGIYKVTVPNGTHLAKFANKPGNIGTVLSDSNNQIAGQATLNPMVCDPTAMFMAATLANIDKKLDSILEIQQEMFDYIKQKDKAEVRGDLTFLSDILENYKYNWNNDKYKSSNHIKVLDIKQSAEHKINLYRSLIRDKATKRNLIHSDKDVKKQVSSVQEEFKEYQLSLYLYAYAAFLEVMLLENYEAAYLEGICKRIEQYSLDYEVLYTEVYGLIEGYSKSSIQTNLLKGVSKVSKAAGTMIEKVPGIRRGQLDETLIGASKKLDDIKSKRTDKIMENLADKQHNYVEPFIDNIWMLSKVYNSDLTIAFDCENLYLLG